MSTAVAIKTDAFTRNASDLFFAHLSQAKQRVLLLDYDGTIAPFSVYRNRAFPYPNIPELLDCVISTCRTRVVLISGRAAREIPPLLGLHPHPEIWGTHGMERLHPDGRYHLARLGDDVRHALSEAEAWLKEEGLERLAERKPGAIAIHWRGLNSRLAAEVKTRACRVLSPLMSSSSLCLTEFDGGLELRPRTHSKGHAVRTILSEIEHLPVAYLGDDSTDEDAFRALQGRGLTVLVRPSYRVTAAQMWLRPPGELIQFLADWIWACGGDL